MSNKKYVRSTKPKSKQEGKVLHQIDQRAKKLLEGYLNGTLTAEQVNQQTAHIQETLKKESINRLVLIELIREHKLTRDCLDTYGVTRIEELSYKKLLEYTKRKELSLTDYRCKSKNPSCMTKRELVDAISYSKYSDLFLYRYDVINVSDASIEQLRTFAIEYHLDTLPHGKTKAETKKLKEINTLLNIIKENGMIQEMLNKYHLSQISSVSISQLEEFTVLHYLVSKEVFCPLVGIDVEDFDEYKERLRMIDDLRNRKELRKCLETFGLSSVNELAIYHIQMYNERKRA